MYKGKIDIKLKNKILESATNLGNHQISNGENKSNTMGDGKENMWVSKLQKITNAEIRKCTGARDISEITRKVKWRYVGHLVRLQKDTWTRKVLEWHPIGKKR